MAYVMHYCHVWQWSDIGRIR